MPKITIVETGLISPERRAQHGSFPQMFERMISAADASASFATVRLIDGEGLPDPAGLEAILITGSSAGVYDDLDWIAPLERFVRAAYEARTSMVGICFGHQLIAQALGGTVRKSERGWGIGRHVYDVVPDNGAIEGEKIAIACSHQDQVVEPPAGAATILHSTFTPHAGLLYENGASCRCSHIPNSPRPLRMFAANSARAAFPKHWLRRPGLRWNSLSITPTSAARSRAFWRGPANRDRIPLAVVTARRLPSVSGDCLSTRE